MSLAFSRHDVSQLIHYFLFRRRSGKAVRARWPAHQHAPTDSRAHRVASHYLRRKEPWVRGRRVYIAFKTLAHTNMISYPHPMIYTLLHHLKFTLLPPPYRYTPTHAPGYWIDTFHERASKISRLEKI